MDATAPTSKWSQLASQNAVIEFIDVTLRERDIRLINQGYLTATELAVGQKLLRPVISVTPSSVAF